MEKRELDFIKFKCPICGKFLTSKKNIDQADCPCCETALTFIDEEPPKKKSLLENILNNIIKE